MAKSLNNLGSDYDSKGEYSKAIEYYTKSLGIYENILGNEHPDVFYNFKFIINCLNFNLSNYYLIIIKFGSGYA